MCVCSHTCLTLNNRFQTKMGCWGGAATKPKCQTWLYQSRWQTSGEAGRQGAGTRAETHVARVVPLSVAAHLMVLRGRRLARCRVDAVMLLAYGRRRARRPERVNDLVRRHLVRKVPRSPSRAWLRGLRERDSVTAAESGAGQEPRGRKPPHHQGPGRRPAGAR